MLCQQISELTDTRCLAFGMLPVVDDRRFYYRMFTVKIKKKQPNYITTYCIVIRSRQLNIGVIQCQYSTRRCDV